MFNNTQILLALHLFSSSGVRSVVSLLESNLRPDEGREKKCLQVFDKLQVSLDERNMNIRPHSLNYECLNWAHDGEALIMYLEKQHARLNIRENFSRPLKRSSQVQEYAEPCCEEKEQEKRPLML